MTYTMTTTSAPDNLGRCYILLEWQDERRRAQMFHMRPDELTAWLRRSGDSVEVRPASTGGATGHS